MTLTETVRAQTRQAVAELLAAARMRAGDIFIIGCSSSEVVGQRIGCGSSMEAAQAVWEGAAPLLAESGLYLAAQCCEHLNRAIVVERAALPPWAETVNAVPQPHAGGSFATAAYAHMADPVLVENIRAGAGIDIGGTLIGMHLRLWPSPCGSVWPASARPAFFARARGRNTSAAAAPYIKQTNWRCRVK